MVVLRLREWCMQGHADVVSNNSKKNHQTWGPAFGRALYMQARKNAPIILAVGGSKTFCLCLNLNSAGICWIPHIHERLQYEVLSLVSLLDSRRILLSLRRFGIWETVSKLRD